MIIKNSASLNHGVVNVGDLPIPFDIVLNSSALVVLITFVYLKVSWKESIITPRQGFLMTSKVLLENCLE